MTTTQLLIVICMAAAACLITAVTGCGGTSSADSALTKNQFIARADAICSKAEGEQLRRVVALVKQHPGVEEEEIAVPVDIPPLEKEVTRIRSLAAPEEDATKVDSWLEQFEAALKKAKLNPASLLNRDDNPFQGPNELAKSYGLSNCAAAP